MRAINTLVSTCKLLIQPLKATCYPNLSRKFSIIFTHFLIIRKDHNQTEHTHTSWSPVMISCKHMSHSKTKPTKWLVRPAKWASTQSDQRLYFPHEEAMGPWLSNERATKTDQTELICVFTGRTFHFVSFVMLRVICIVSLDM